MNDKKIACRQILHRLDQRLPGKDCPAPYNRFLDVKGKHGHEISTKKQGRVHRDKGHGSNHDRKGPGTKHTLSPPSNIAPHLPPFGRQPLPQVLDAQRRSQKRPRNAQERSQRHPYASPHPATSTCAVKCSQAEQQNGRENACI